MKHFLIVLFFISIILHSQQKSVSGRIETDRGEALASANIIILNSDIGTVSDKNGEFKLSGDFGYDEIIRISFIGYQNVFISVADFEQLAVPTIIMNPSVLTSQTVLVKAIIGKEGETPASFSKIDKTELRNNYVNQDIPEMLSYLPSTTFYSEGGGNVGYNYLSIRGFDQRRISVSINGIPQNDPEDHNVYWVDFPDLLASTELIQVQRGAGSGVAGYPAIGGSINIITSSFSNENRTELDTKWGSYNTRKYSAAFSSGLINNKYSVYMKLGHLLSDGYKDNNWVDFKSYYLSAVRYDENITTQINFFGGPISDGLTYTGVAKFAVKDKKLRKQNFSYWEAEGSEYTYTLSRRKDEIESFSQPHYELLNEFRINQDVVFNSALFLVVGKGYFDYDGSWSVYYDDYFRLKASGFGDDAQANNALIRAQVENNQWGWVPRISIKHSDGELILGGELRFHKSLHWGNINYAEGLPAGVTKDFRYYQYEGAKDIYNLFVNENYKLNENIGLLAELQLASHRYSISNEKYLKNDFEIDNLFLNPRLALNYKINEQLNSYLSLARVTREPRLKNYYDAAESSGGEIPQFELNDDGSYNFEKPLVKPEVMNNIELGINYLGEEFNVSLNLFFMQFTDEIVSKGQVDRFGQPVTGNIESTIHSGIELSGRIKFNKIFNLILNGSYSKNYIQKGKHFITGTDVIDLKDNPISGFPELTFNAILDFNYKNIMIQLTGKYVGQFYTDNYGEKIHDYLDQFPGFIDYSDNKVENYFVANLLANYEFDFAPVLNKAKVFIQINNLFDNLYAAYGIGKEYFPAAERNIMTGVTIGL